MSFHKPLQIAAKDRDLAELSSDGVSFGLKNQALAAYQQSHARASGLAFDAFVRAAFDSTAPFSRPLTGTLASIAR